MVFKHPLPHLVCISPAAARALAKTLVDDNGYAAVADGAEVIGPMDDIAFVFHMGEAALASGAATDVELELFQAAAIKYARFYR